jgi:hypothetical protein
MIGRLQDEDANSYAGLEQRTGDEPCPAGGGHAVRKAQPVAENDDLEGPRLVPSTAAGRLADELRRGHSTARRIWLQPHDHSGVRDVAEERGKGPEPCGVMLYEMWIEPMSLFTVACPLWCAMVSQWFHRQQIHRS